MQKLIQKKSTAKNETDEDNEETGVHKTAMRQIATSNNLLLIAGIYREVYLPRYMKADKVDNTLGEWDKYFGNK